MKEENLKKTFYYVEVNVVKLVYRVDNMYRYKNTYKSKLMCDVYSYWF